MARLASKAIAICMIVGVGLVISPSGAQAADIVPGTPITLDVPVGSVVDTTFSAVAGQQFSVRAQPGTLSDATVSIVSPSGSVLSSSPAWCCWRGGYADTAGAFVTGTYKVRVSAAYFSGGTVTLTLYDVPPDASGAISFGAPVTSVFSTPGQNRDYTFTGSLGQVVSLNVTTGGIGDATVTVRKPDGSTLVSGSWGTWSGIFFDKTTLPASGQYTIHLDPWRAQTGQMTLALNQVGSFQPPEQTTGVQCDPLGGGSLGKAPCGMISDPVNTLTGAFTHAETDLSTSSTGVPIELTRTYSSAETASGRLGPGWTDTYQASLAVQPNGDVIAKGDEGQRLSFVSLGGGAFDGGPGAQSTLVSIAGGYRLTTFEQLVYEFDTAGKLLTKKDRNGQGVTLAYDGSGRLATVTDSASKTATFAYNASNLVSGVSLSDGRSVGYGYTAGRLTSFTDVRGKTWQYTYDGAGRLATIVDPLAHAQVSNVYDAASGRVVSQADALNKTTTFAWDAGTQTATVTDPNNHVWKDVYVNNVLVKRIDGTNGTTEFGFDAELNGTLVKGPSNETTTMTYDASGNLLTATAPASLGSAQKTFVYNAKNDPTQVTDARATVTAYGYDTAGNQTTVTQAGVTVATMTYDTAGRVLTSTNGNGKTTTYTYDAAGNTLSETDPLGNKTTFTYDAAGRMLTRVDPKGNVSGCSCAAQFMTTFTYNAAGQVLTETDQLGKTTTSTYDDAGNLLTKTDGNGKVTAYVYDNANRVTSVTAADGGVSLTSYDDAGNKLTETDPLGHVTTHTYDSANRLVSSTTASGAKTTMFYDANGNLVKQVEPRGNVVGANPDDYATTFTYDAAGRVLTETDPLAHVTTHVYDAVGNEIQVTDPNGKTTVSVYDARNRLSTVTAPDGGVTTYTYDAEGNKLTVKDPRNNITASTYDDANRLASVTKPSGGKTTYAYDANGNQTSMVEARGNVSGCGCAAQYTWTTAFDRANRKLSETSPLGHVTSYTYDGVGNQLTVTDANNHQTVTTYDSVNRVKTVTAPDLGVTTNTYDLAGNLVSRKDARNNTTTYAYDLDNRRTSVTNPLGKIWTTGYDAAGNVVSTTDANGNATVTAGDGTTTSTYDRAGRLTGVDYSDTTPDVAYTYDNAGNRLTMVDGAGTQTRTYDSVNRLLSVTRGTDVFSYVYDLAGNLTKRTYPGGAVTDSTYDVDNRMATAVNAALTTTYAYDVAGNLVSTTLPSANGHVETRVYDRSGRVTEVKNQKGTTVLSKFALTLDPVGNPTTSVRTGGVSQTQVHTYDVNNRILSTCFQAATCPVGSAALVTWTYDKVGNRLTEKRSSTTVTSTFNTADQLTAAGSTSYTYDSNGNQLTAGTRTFTYDLANRLKTTGSGSTTTTYTYDGDGVRQQASTGTAASAKTNFVWDVNQPNAQVALERNGSNTLQRQYIYGLKRIRQTVGTASYFHTDQLGSVTNTTSASGASQRTWSYEPYGVIRTSTGTSPANFVNFTGEYLDPTGLYHLRARQYDPASGRFTRTDPVENSASGSQYAYVSDRPTVSVDPAGLWAVPPAGVMTRGLSGRASSPHGVRCGSRSGGEELVYPFDSGWHVFGFAGFNPDTGTTKAPGLRAATGVTGAYFYARINGRARTNVNARAYESNLCVELGLSWDMRGLDRADEMTLALGYKHWDSQSRKLSNAGFCDYPAIVRNHYAQHDGRPCNRRFRRTKGLVADDGRVASTDNVDLYRVDLERFQPGRVSVIGSVYRHVELNGLLPAGVRLFPPGPIYGRELSCNLQPQSPAACGNAEAKG
jgi:RHS repeat-associated protein